VTLAAGPVLDLDLLTALLRLPTAGPLEVGPDAPVELWAA